ncbi:hypothetical protein [Actinoplanes sp. G11-F43]|uniref:hypothetical protein n=1 Tax=Actinoplanes sp. G11-F43 TaxID=3424130 RepID=UPI003D334489
MAGRLRLPAGHHIRLWRYHHRSAEELGSMLVKAGYIPRYEHRSPDGEYLLLTGTTG